jgi:Protein  of unknown function (DUF3018)
MNATSTPKSSRTKVREHSDRLGKQALQLIEIWGPDVHSRAFRSEAHRQSVLVSSSAHAHEDQAFVSAI